MEPATMSAEEARQRSLLFLPTPKLWPLWPYLPVVRRKPACEEELGLVFDALHATELPGYSSTVFLCNLFLLPPSLDEFLALPKETFDTAEEMVNAGWTVD